MTPQHLRDSLGCCASGKMRFGARGPSPPIAAVVSLIDAINRGEEGWSLAAWQNISVSAQVRSATPSSARMC